MRILNFSGGLDSLATLYTLRDTWDTLYLLWVNTGAAYPDTIALMEKVKKLSIAGFFEIKSDQPSWIRDHGYPVDVLPVWTTSIGKAVTGSNGQAYQSPFSCCGMNIWGPMNEASNKLKASIIYRGQRKSDKRKAPIESGYELNGITYIFPIEDWSREQVRAYVAERCPELVPEYYGTEDSSHDCMDCTAYLDENVQRIGNLPAEARLVVQGRLKQLIQKLDSGLTHIKEASRDNTV